MHSFCKVLTIIMSEMTKSCSFVYIHLISVNIIINYVSVDLDLRRKKDIGQISIKTRSMSYIDVSLIKVSVEILSYVSLYVSVHVII